MITSTSNQKIKKITNLLKKTKARREEGLFACEGRKMFLEVLTQFPERIEEAFFTEDCLAELSEGENGAQVKDALTKIKYETVDDKIFSQIAETVTPQGVIALVKTPVYELGDLLGEKTKLLVLDDLRDPGNLGTIVRTAEAAGMSGILLSKESVDITNPKVVRSTMGAIYRVPFFYAENLVETLKEIKKVKPELKAYASALHHDSKLYNEVDYSGDVAVVIGNESNGVSEAVIGESDETIYIPMQGKVESLNAAVAAAVIMYKVQEA